MNCYECQTENQRVTPAVAVCSQCGAATCVDHTNAGHAYTEIHSPGALHLHEVPGRRMYCSTCSADRAELAAAGATATG
ncbi:DUF2180 family protein [Occultella kanbiaonis]|uniref:DUF2180 family protein n=1 Tax=Occultella kanbiaonis TaxID=2675754 RepID=UPI0013CF49DC|nr:DUF2180 family protein [Occultella kanbiaonis]